MEKQVLCILGALVALVSVINAQNLVDIKRIPKRITPTMCECAAGIRTEEREARRKAAQKQCSDAEGLGIPDFDSEVQEEVRKKLPRGLAQWARKQVETPGVDYKCLNLLREFYFYQNKIQTFLDPLPQEKKEAYAVCFGKNMGWLNKETGELDKAAIRKEISGSPTSDPKLRQSLELLSLTCRGSKASDLESYIRCASRPCADPEFFDAVIGKNKNTDPSAEAQQTPE